MGRKWTKEEIETLKSYFENTLPNDRDITKIAEQLRRTVASVGIKANRCLRLGFSRFSTEEDRQILEYYRSTPSRKFDLSVIARELGRPRTSVSWRAKKLGVSNIKRPKRTLLYGDKNPQWRGDNVKRKEAGHRRAQRLFPDLGMCERCSTVKAVERHHVDGNTFNNIRSNVQKLCRRCHMVVDGRLEKSFELLQSLPRKIRNIGDCCICRRSSMPLTTQRCHSCYEYLRKHGVEWTPGVGAHRRGPKRINSGPTPR